MQEGLNFKGCPIKHGFEELKPALEKAGTNFKHLNTRKALELSLISSDKVEDFIGRVIPEYNSLDIEERSKIVRYVLIADLLKRGLWDDLKKTVLKNMSKDNEQLLKNEDLGPSYLSETWYEDSWFNKVDEVNHFILVHIDNALGRWVESFSDGSDIDNMYKKRYVELDLLAKKYSNPNTEPYTPREIISSGVRTGIEYPMGMLKFIPELIKKSNRPVSLESIEKIFFFNLLKISSTYAVQDIVSFSALDQQINGGVDRPVKPVNFSSEYFQLDTKGYICFNSTVFNYLKECQNAEYEKMPDETIAILGCPLLFSNIIVQEYESIFRPIFDRIKEIQREYK